MLKHRSRPTASSRNLNLCSKTCNSSAPIWICKLRCTTLRADASIGRSGVRNASIARMRRRETCRCAWLRACGAVLGAQHDPGCRYAFAGKLSRMAATDRIGIGGCRDRGHASLVRRHSRTARGTRRTVRCTGCRDTGIARFRVTRAMRRVCSACSGERSRPLVRSRQYDAAQSAARTPSPVAS